MVLLRTQYNNIFNQYDSLLTADVALLEDDEDDELEELALLHLGSNRFYPAPGVLIVRPDN